MLRIIQYQEIQKLSCSLKIFLLVNPTLAGWIPVCLTFRSCLNPDQADTVGNSNESLTVF